MGYGRQLLRLPSELGTAFLSGKYTFHSAWRLDRQAQEPKGGSLLPTLLSQRWFSLGAPPHGVSSSPTSPPLCFLPVGGRLRRPTRS